MKFEISRSNWGFKPLTICLKFAGINLTNPSSLNRLEADGFIIASLGFIIFLSNAIINGPRLLDLVKFEFLTSDNKCEISPWLCIKEHSNLHLKFTYYAASIVLIIILPVIHVVYFILDLFLPNLKVLWILMNKIQLEMELDEIFHKKIRKNCFFAMLLLLLDFSYFVWSYSQDSTLYICDHHWQWQNHKHFGWFHRMISLDPFPLISALWARLVEIGIRTSFVAFAFVASLFFQELNSKLMGLIEVSNSDHSSGSQKIVMELHKCMISYNTICDFVEQINKSFGFILLLIASNDIVSSILKFDKLMLFYDQSPRFYFNFLHDILRFLVIIAASFVVDSEASNLSSALNQFHLLNNPSVLIHLNAAKIKIATLTAPVISALKIFNLHELKAFIALIDLALQWGAAIRYSIIMLSYLGFQAYNEVGLTDTFIDGRCGVDYSPCYCYSYVRQTGIRCVDVNLPDVSMAFQNRTTLDVEIFLLHFPRTTDIIADLIGIHHRITDEIDLKCSKTGYFFQHQLTIHPDAFRSSRNFTRSVKITKCDLKKLDFSFLSGFSRLQKLLIFDSVNVHQTYWRSFASSPNFHSLKIQRCRLSGWKSFPRLSIGLKSAVLCSDDIDDATMDRTLNWLVKTSSGTLQYLHIATNSLTRFPAKISSFKNLYDAFISNQIVNGNGIAFLSSSSYVSSGSLGMLDLSLSGIKFIEPGAFSGDFSRTMVVLDKNLLTRFDKSIFLDMLQQMDNSTGFISVFDNPFDCTEDPCHLAWLIRDRPHLLRRLKTSIMKSMKDLDGKEFTKQISTYPTCSNGTSFDHLDREAFLYCR